MNYYIVTGTSSGIGEAIAKKLIHRKEKVFCISRQINESLKALATKNHSGLWYYETDLTQTGKIPGILKEIFSFIDEGEVANVVLINNAGTLEPLGKSGSFNPGLIENHFKTNVIAPAILINEFIRLSERLNAKKTIVNISSGAASTPYAGWSNYCAAKSALDMLTRTIGEEQKSKENPVRIFSVAPGIVDTKMQETIRNTNEEQFPMREKFEKLFTENRLSKPDDVADKIISLLFSDFPLTGDVADLRNL